MNARLYTIGLSHPGHAARLMLEHKGIEHRVTVFPEGLHPVLVRLAGFKGHTVPALKIDGEKVQHSLEIAAVLDRIQPDPPLYPRDPAKRAAVEEAERWAEAELQPLARRMLRWSLTQQLEGRRWMVEVSGLPAPRVQARTSRPLVRLFARAVDATSETVRQDLAELPAKLDRADALIADGTISMSEPNAATFQAGTSIRALTLFPQLVPLIEGRPCGRLAHALLPDFPQSPVRLPEEWLPAGAG